MSLSLYQQYQLYRIESRLLRSDPHLAAMLTVFARLCAGECMPAGERAASGPDRVRQAAILIVKAIVDLALAAGLLLGAVRTRLTAIVIGVRTRPPQSARQQTAPRTDGQANPATKTWNRNDLGL
jgi:hypothetical protein